MHSAHNGTDYGSIPCGLNYKKNNIKIMKRVLGRVWFMALVLKTSTFFKVVSSNLTVPDYSLSFF